MKASAVKRAVRERDGDRCVICGVTAARHRRVCGKGLEVHRVVPGTPYTVAGSRLLCGACHVKQPRSPKGTSHSVTLHFERADLLAALKVDSVRGISVPGLVLRLLAQVPEEARQAVLCQARAERPHAGTAATGRKRRGELWNFRLPRSLATALRTYAAASGLTLTAVVNQALGLFLHSEGFLPPPGSPP